MECTSRLGRAGHSDWAGQPVRAAVFIGVLAAGAAPLLPLVLLTTQHAPQLLPLFAVPLAVLFAAWRIARERIRDQATDPLTGLANRDSLLRAAREAIGRASTAHASGTFDGGRVALILFDLDRFRSLNDTLGHAVGDRLVGSSRVDLQACKLEYSIVSPK